MKRATLLAIIVIAGCHTADTGPYNPPGEASRETSKAEGLNREAAELLNKDPVHAEALLREALTADLFFGPAHNNLGVVFLNGGKLYEAAGEFEWARKLMPGQPDPRVNLALTLECAGHFEDAFAAYHAALDVAPEDLSAIEGLASLTLRTSRKEPQLHKWLECIALRSEDQSWRGWAMARLARDAPSATSAVEPR